MPCVAKMQNTVMDSSMSNDLYRDDSFDIAESFKHQCQIS